MSFHYRHQVQFYETDMMGIVHHSNYIRICEEARVAWAHDRGLIDYQKPESAAYFAVLETSVQHLKPLRFGDVAEVELQAKLEGIRIYFEYKMKILNSDVVVAKVRTSHVALNQELKAVKPTEEMKTIFEREVWTETWL